MGETPLTGADAEKATAAAEAEVPGGTVLRVETDADGTYEAHVKKADGTEVEVKMDKDFNVTSVEEFGGMRADSGSPTPPRDPVEQPPHRLPRCGGCFVCRSSPAGRGSRCRSAGSPALKCPARSSRAS